jgi:hypothetical protein
MTIRAEEQCDRRGVDRQPGLGRGKTSRRGQRDGAEQRDAASIEGKARKFSEHHARIDHEEDQSDENIHRW